MHWFSIKPELFRIQVLYVSECKDLIGINVINFYNLKPMHLRRRKNNVLAFLYCSNSFPNLASE